MPTIYQDLKLENDPSTIVRPNIEGANIPTSAVDSSKIATGAVTNGKIAALAVTNDKIASRTITKDKIAANTITNDEIENLTIQGGKLANQTLTMNKVKLSVTVLDNLGLPNIAALANVLAKFLVEPNGYKIYYFKAIETDYDEYSTIEFDYVNSTDTLKIHMLGQTFTLADQTSFGNFMTAYAKYIYIVNIF